MLELDQDPVADSFVAVERSGKLFIPICAVAEAISLSINCAEDRAFGFVLEQSRPFVVDLTEGHAISGRTVFKTGDAAFRHGGDIVVEAAELSRWLPVDFKYDAESSTVHMRARELLPVQGFKKRQKIEPAPVPLAPKQFDDYTPSRAAFSVPTLDLTSQVALAGDGRGTLESSTLNTLGLSGDLLYLSSEAHLAVEDRNLKRLDFALFRRNDAGFKVGPLPLTQLLVGTSQVPNLDGIGGPSTPMYGLFLSNRPLSGASRFLTHDIDGYLPAGWDAELFHNGSPIGYQPPTQDGMYHFQNLKIQYGLNDFRVVMHGPFGETREVEQAFFTDATTPTGEFLYSLSGAWQTGLTVSDTPGPDCASNLTFTSDFGMLPGIAGSVLAVRQTDNYGLEQDYAGVGVRTAVGYTLLSLELIQSFAPAAGKYGQFLELRTSSRDLFGVALQAEQRFFRNFESQCFPGSTDPLLSQTHAKLTSSLSGWDDTRIPLTLELGLDAKRTGGIDWTTIWRGGWGWRGWNGALEADISSLRGSWNANAGLQISTRVREVSVRGQVGFSLAPDLAPSVINLSADKDLGNGFQLNGGLIHTPASDSTGVLIGLSKRFGLVGYSISATGSSTGAYSFNLGLSTSLAADRYNRQAVVSAEALSPSGMITVSAVTPASGNNPARELPGIGFLVNGSRALTVAGSKGVPVIAFLRPDIAVDITVDIATVEDPFMVPKEDGCHITPRAGVMSFCRFTMVSGGEIDGMVLVRVSKNEELPLKGVRLGLAAAGADPVKLLAGTLSEESGYYVFKGVKPGSYQIVIPAEEIARLKTSAPAPIAVTMPGGGDQVSGKDFVLERAAAEKQDATGAKAP